MSLEREFLKATHDVKKTNPDDNQKLELYGLYKQATVGDCDKRQPSLLNLRERYKWTAWNNMKGKSKEEAMRMYVDLVKKL